MLTSREQQSCFHRLQLTGLKVNVLVTHSVSRQPPLPHFQVLPPITKLPTLLFIFPYDSFLQFPPTPFHSLLYILIWILPSISHAPSIPYLRTGYYLHPQHWTKTIQMFWVHSNPPHYSQSALLWSVGSNRVFLGSYYVNMFLQNGLGLLYM